MPCRRGNWGRTVYKLLAGKHQYAVDYGYYMHELALDLGAVPRLGSLLLRPRAFWGYGFGQAFTSWFRLTGPFAAEEMWDVCCGELFRTTLGRGLAANLNFVAMNIVLGGFGGVVGKGPPNSDGFGNNPRSPGDSPRLPPGHPTPPQPRGRPNPSPARALTRPLPNPCPDPAPPRPVP